MAAIHFLFDYISPYAYLASTQIRELAQRHGREVVYVPVLFARLLDAHGTRGPAEITAKREYLYRDVLRIARMLDVPIAPPASHPFNPLAALRMTLAIDDAPSRARFVDAVFGSAWVRGERVEEEDVLSTVASELGLDTSELGRRAHGSEVKSELRAHTEDAIVKGVFGVPTMVADGEMFWGVDSLALLDRFLAGERAAPLDVLAHWQAIRPSAVRPRASSGVT